MVKVRQNLMPSSLYGWKSPYTMKPTRIVVHNTANDASADAEIKYMNKSEAEGGRQTSFHYAVDDKEAVQGLPENRNGWHSGDGNGKGNREGIAIEICYSKSGGSKFTKAEQNAVELIVDILNRYGWGIDKVTKHQDYANKYCPHRTLDMGWTRFIDMIKAKLSSNQPAPTPTTPTTKLKYSKGDKVVLNGYLYRDSFGNGRGSKKTNYKGTITIVNAKGTKPYHIDAIGWVAESDITKETTPVKKSVDEVAKEVINGKWGNGEDRKTRLTNAGYNYDEVQAKVNEILYGTSPKKKSVDEVAREVIAGKWGNNPERKKRLEAEGYNYREVQNRVNQLLK